MNKSITSKQVTIGQAAKLFAVSKGTIRNWIHAGKLQAVIDVNGIHLISQESINNIKTKKCQLSKSTKTARFCVAKASSFIFQYVF